VKMAFCAVLRMFVVVVSVMFVAGVLSSCVSVDGQPDGGAVESGAVAGSGEVSADAAPAVAEIPQAEPMPQSPVSKKTKKKRSSRIVREALPQLDGAVTYVVQEGDTLGTISQKVFGTCKMAKKLGRLNNIKNYNKIRVGDVLLVKKKTSTESQPSVQGQTREGSAEKVVQVAKGDSLWKIAGRELGDPYAWREILASNPSVKSSGTIHEGMKLVIPVRSRSGSEVAPSTSGG
jgi:nucleoid-associated protein YgaU